MKSVSSLGEFGLIDIIRKSFKMDSSVIVGPGDDCAVIRRDKKYYELQTCDAIVEGVDFKRSDDPLLIGRKALAISISDIAACGGVPKYCLITLAMPSRTSSDFVDGLIEGARMMADEFGINIVGGDISRAKEIMINTSMTGLVEKDRLTLRNGARRGDIIFVTGTLGGSIRGKHLSFTPRAREARYLAKFKPSSMIDISDGLAQDLAHVLEQSKAGAVIYEDLIPLSDDCRGIDEALYMGEDFELLFTLPLPQARKLSRLNMPIATAIGEIFPRSYGLRMIDKNNRYKTVEARGFRHF